MEHDSEGRRPRTWSRNQAASGGGAVYSMGMIGALVYYMQNAHSFGAVALGVLKALLWPAFMVYEALRHLN